MIKKIMAQLAIKGHSTRSKEVLELLKMIGGKNFGYFTCNYPNKFYYVLDEYIHWDYIGPKEINKYVIFTLEEFLEKFPYKVGDKVSVYEYESKVRINDMKWDGFEIQYSVFTDETEWYSAEELNKCNEPYKEETMRTITIDDFKANTKEWLIDKLGNMSTKDALQTINNIYNKLYEPQYPKTYKECCGVLGIEEDLWFVYKDIDSKHINPACISNYRIRRLNLYHNFEKLLICRDAYWKIAGEQMGLGKPWERNYCDRCFIIANNKGNIHTYEYHGDNNVILAFPTAEMRDAFYENFKELIENVKELL